MNENTSPPAAQTSIAPSVGRARVNRRAMLRAGAGASPVLLTLVSNPVAASSGCVVASSFVSVATFKSRNPTTRTISCATRTVESWRDACVANPTLAAVVPTVATTFGSSTSTYNMNTLRQILCHTSGIQQDGELGVLQHLTALHLSVTQGHMSAGAGGNMGLAYLSSIWMNYKTNGGRYAPAGSGISWGSRQLIRWLKYQLNYGMTL